MRLIMYYPRFPTNSNPPAELDALPPSFPRSGSPNRMPGQQTVVTAISHANGTGTAHSTIYRVSAGGIHASHQPTSMTNGKYTGGNDHKRDMSHGEDGRTTPTQSSTLAMAKGEAKHLKLDSTDWGTLTEEEIRNLQAEMLESMQHADARPLISMVQSMDILMSEYAENATFLKKMEWLKQQGWLGVRRTKGDGDCFYRSFAFAWVERILRAEDREFATASAISKLQTTWIELGEVGFDTTILEDFYDVLRSLVEQVIKPEHGGRTLNASILLEAFTTPEASNSIVSYMRILTSAELQKHPESYIAFIVHPETQESMDLVQFCHLFVEGMGREADHVQMQALSRALGVNLSIAYLDGSDNPNGEVDFVKFEDGVEGDNGLEDVVLLYRPGHYDILEHRSSEHERSAASTLVTPSVME